MVYRKPTTYNQNWVRNLLSKFCHPRWQILMLTSVVGQWHFWDPLTSSSLSALLLPGRKAVITSEILPSQKVSESWIESLIHLKLSPEWLKITWFDASSYCRRLGWDRCNSVTFPSNHTLQSFMQFCMKDLLFPNVWTLFGFQEQFILLFKAIRKQALATFSIVLSFLEFVWIVNSKMGYIDNTDSILWAQNVTWGSDAQLFQAVCEEEKRTSIKHQIAFVHLRSDWQQQEGIFNYPMKGSFNLQDCFQQVCRSNGRRSAKCLWSHLGLSAGVRPNQCIPGMDTKNVFCYFQRACKLRCENCLKWGACSTVD